MILHAISLAITMIPQAADSTDADKGSYLVRACQAYVRMVDSIPSKNLEIDAAYTGYCVGYMAGFVAGISDGPTKVCFNTASSATMARVYVAYMQKTPKLFDSDQRQGMKEALMDAYPCSSKP